MALKRLGCLNGNSTISLIDANCFRQPPTSSYPIEKLENNFNRGNTRSHTDCSFHLEYMPFLEQILAYIFFNSEHSEPENLKKSSQKTS